MLKTRHAIPMTFLAGLALMAVAPLQASLISDFTGPYDVSNWTQLIQGDGDINVSGAPATIVLIGSDDRSGGEENVDFSIASDGDGIVTFFWQYLTTDNGGPLLDPFGYLLRGVFIPLTDAAPAASSQVGIASFSVTKGDVFGFRQSSRNGLNGRAITAIRDFRAPGVSAVPEPATLSLLALGVAGLVLMRRRAKLQLEHPIPHGTNAANA